MDPALRNEPIGRLVGDVARSASRAFAAALAQHGGSLPLWQVLLALKQEHWRTQQELARAVGIESPTLTRHLDNFEAAGLLVRRRDARDRRVVRVELTDAGEAMFRRLRRAAAGFDRQLRAGFSDAELQQLRTLLTRLAANVSDRPR